MTENSLYLHALVKAAGKGTRMQEVTGGNIPKSLVEVQGVPVNDFYSSIKPTQDEQLKEQSLSVLKSNLSYGHRRITLALGINKKNEKLSIKNLPLLSCEVPIFDWLSLFFQITVLETYRIINRLIRITWLKGGESLRQAQGHASRSTIQHVDKFSASCLIVLVVQYFHQLTTSFLLKTNL